MTTDHECAEAYPAQYLEDMGAGLRYTDWILSHFEPWLKGHICEVGAGTGNVSIELIKQAVEKLTLLEPDAGLFQTLEKKVSGNTAIHAKNTSLANYGTQFESQQNAFVYINVLEHIEDDVGELELMLSHLRPGGAALIFVPALPFLYSQYDREIGHFRRYTKSELQQKIAQAGFHLEEIRYFDFIGIFAWYLVCKLLKLRPGSGNISIYDKAIVPFSRVIESAIPPMIGKNLLAVAIKQ
jgi:SAM-dependent methyltransferase